MSTDAETDRVATEADDPDPRSPRRGRSGLKALWILVPLAMRLVWTAARRPLIMTVVLQFALALLLAAQLLLGRYVLNELIIVGRDDGELGGLLLPFLGMIAALIAAGVVTALSGQYQRLLTEHVGRHTYEEIIDVATHVEYSAFEDSSFHDQLERARTAGLYRPLEMVNSVVTILSGAFTSAGVGIVLAVLEPVLLPITLLAGIPVLVSTLINSRQAYEFEYRMTHQGRERYYLMQLLTSLDSAKEIRLFGAGKLLSARWNALTDERFVELHKYLRKRLRVAVAGAVGASLGTAFALGSLAWLLGTGRTSVATAVTAGVAMTVLTTRIRSLYGATGMLVESGMFLEDFVTFLEVARRRTDPDAGDLGKGAELPSDRFDGLRVEHLTFTYPSTGKRALEDVSLEVAPGEIVALVGENGSGKTTLIKLLCQLYAQDSGRILWSGTDTRELPAGEIQRDMTVLFQDYVTYLLTVADNIALGRTSRPADRESIRAAAVRASADDYIAALRSGYETRLGLAYEGGAELSIGQWQRLALARAFFRGGPFLIMDEPTASLDPRAEYELFSQMRDLAEGRSVLLVSHRFSSVRNADRIYVMRDGRVVESGSHDQLLALDGHYAELHGLQAHTFARRS
jgi:ATP-binding cassette subfamily B protein